MLIYVRLGGAFRSGGRGARGARAGGWRRGPSLGRRRRPESRPVAGRLSASLASVS